MTELEFKVLKAVELIYRSKEVLDRLTIGRLIGRTTSGLIVTELGLKELEAKEPDRLIRHG